MKKSHLKIIWSKIFRVFKLMALRWSGLVWSGLVWSGLVWSGSSS